MKLRCKPENATIEDISGAATVHSVLSQFIDLPAGDFCDLMSLPIPKQLVSLEPKSTKMLVFQSALNTSLNADPESNNRRFVESEMIPSLRGDETRAF